MAKVRIRHILNGYRKVRSAPKVKAELDGRANRIAAAGNALIGSDGYRTSSVQGKGVGRHRATVITARREAMKHNAETNFLVMHINE